ncbi:cuticle protein 7-like [Venturia canescens]|uniref:cuticle protein 7-like n=1 Tax=Venturia canescens TaxID=32260 RepID=UPI001C9D4F78|nr:cuticle protein 7-like [Venturia canescens]
MFNPILIFIVLASPCLGDVSHILPEYKERTTVTPPPPPRPYQFEYAAGRYPGHVDRIQQESGDGSGVIHGSYSFIDPKQKVRTVEYTADKNGFHPTLVNFEDTQAQPVDTEAVQLAKEKHFRLYHKLAEANSHGAPSSYVPRETVGVAREKERHFSLYNKIAQEHAAIAAQRKAFEATSVPNDVEESHLSYDQYN